MKENVGIAKMEAKDREVLVQLITKLDTLIERVEKMVNKQDNSDNRLREVETKVAVNNKLLENNDDEINRLRSSSNWKDAVIAIATLIGIILAALLS